MAVFMKHALANFHLTMAMQNMAYFDGFPQRAERPAKGAD